MTTVQGWNTVAENPLVLVTEYSFGPGPANAMAVALPNDKILIMSPPCGAPPATLDALKDLGTVVALIETNGAHHMGLGECQRVFGEAKIYAPESAAARIRKKGKDFGDLEPLSALEPLLGDKVSVITMLGEKIGDVIVRVETEKGTLLYAGDPIGNFNEAPGGFPINLIFKWTNSAPGFKVNHIFFRLFVRDRKAMRDFLIREVETHPPAIIVPAHGAVLEQSNLGPTVGDMLRAAI